MIQTIGDLNKVCQKNQGYTFLISSNMGMTVYNAKPSIMNFIVKDVDSLQLRFDDEGNVEIYMAKQGGGWNEQPSNKLIATESLMFINDNGMGDYLPQGFLATIYEIKPFRYRLIQKYFGHIARYILYGNMREF